MQKSSDTTKIYKGDFNLTHNPILLEQHMDKVNNKETKRIGIITLLNIEEKNDNGTMIFDNGSHQEFAFIYKQDDLTYIVPMCADVNRIL